MNRTETRNWAYSWSGGVPKLPDNWTPAKTSSQTSPLCIRDTCRNSSRRRNSEVADSLDAGGNYISVFTPGGRKGARVGNSAALLQDLVHLPHVLITTRTLTAEGFTDKTRVLDAAKTGGVEIGEMRGLWAELQNRALERAGEIERVDHRALDVQHEEALSRGDELTAEALDRAPEVEGREYELVTERGRAVHATRRARTLYAEMRTKGGSAPGWPRSGPLRRRIGQLSSAKSYYCFNAHSPATIGF